MGLFMSKVSINFVSKAIVKRINGKWVKSDININSSTNSIRNLTRKVTPSKTDVLLNGEKKYIADMPEAILKTSIRSGDESIMYVKMNECKGTEITSNGINTIFTDGLTGCNSVGIVTKNTCGNPYIIMAHAMPTPKSIAMQCSEIERLLLANHKNLNQSVKPEVFFNVKDISSKNPIFESVKNVLTKFFKQGHNKTINAYEVNIGTLPSTANIFQFNPKNLNELKITNVNEKEHFVNLI